MRKGSTGTFIGSDQHAATIAGIAQGAARALCAGTVIKRFFMTICRAVTGVWLPVSN